MVGHLPEGIERRRWLVAGALGAALLLGLVLYLVSGDEPDSSTAARVTPDGSAVQAAGASPDAVLARAHAALEAGQLESPEGGNALDLYRAVLLSQPEHAEAHAGLERTTGLVLAQAHAEAGAGRGDEARRLVRRVLAADPANAVALAMQARLEAPPADTSVAASASSRITAAAAWFAAARPATQTPQARATAAKPASLPAGQPGVGQGAGAATQPPPALGDPSGNALPASRASAPGTSIAAGASAGGLAAVGPAGAAAPENDARAETPSTANPAGSGPSLVPLREFKRVSITEPTYPADARRDGTEGWVRLQFTVTERGQVRDIVIVGAEPSGVFEGAAAEALQRWRFRPPVAPDGQPVALRSSVVLRFELED
jgi:TonB family protein